MQLENIFNALKGPDTRCNFSCNLQRNSTFGRCKIGKYMFPSQFANIFFTDETFITSLHPLRVELRCKLQENCVTSLSTSWLRFHYLFLVVLTKMQ